MTRTWEAPEGLRTRGTVIVLPGRGEHSGVYERFGRRLSVDAYAVHALDVSVHDDAKSIRNIIAGIAVRATAPVVLAGSDAGALQALALVLDADADTTTATATATATATTTTTASDVDVSSYEPIGRIVDGLVLAALPDPEHVVGGADADAAAEAGDWEWELGARTTCPTHRAHLSEDDAFVRGSLSEPIPSHLAAALGDSGLEHLKIPALILHGGADPVTPVGRARELAARLPRAELAVVETAPHDVLNDSTHRTVAAQIVQWLERLRNGPESAPIITVTSGELAAVR